MYDQAESLFDDGRFRRFFIFSAVGHVVLAVGLWFAPNPNVLLSPPTPVYIDVVSAPAPKAAPRPAPAPEPEAAKAPPKQVVDEVVIPKLPKEPKPAAKAKKKPSPKPPSKKPAAAPPPSAEDLLNKLREKVESRETGTPGSKGRRAGIFDPEKAAYQKKLTALLYSHWAGSAICRMDPKPSNFRIQLATDGSVKSLSMTGSSGNRVCDESAERAIRKVDPLPKPPRGVSTVTITFDPLEIR